MDYLALVAAAYPNTKTEWGFCGPSDYEPMGRAFGDVMLWKECGSYQGDTFALYRDGARRGFLKFGWGSCSGCDALQACHSLEAIAELAKDLHGDIKWFDSAEECLAYLDAADVRNEWYSSDSAFHAFRAEARAVLS